MTTETRRTRTHVAVIEAYLEALSAQRDAEAALRSLGRKLALCGQPGFQVYGESEDAA